MLCPVHCWGQKELHLSQSDSPNEAESMARHTDLRAKPDGLKVEGWRRQLISERISRFVWSTLAFILILVGLVRETEAMAVVGHISSSAANVAAATASLLVAQGLQESPDSPMEAHQYRLVLERLPGRPVDEELDSSDGPESHPVFAVDSPSDSGTMDSMAISTKVELGASWKDKEAPTLERRHFGQRIPMPNTSNETLINRTIGKLNNGNNSSTNYNNDYNTMGLAFETPSSKVNYSTAGGNSGLEFISRLFKYRLPRSNHLKQLGDAALAKLTSATNSSNQVDAGSSWNGSALNSTNSLPLALNSRRPPATGQPYIAQSELDDDDSSLNSTRAPPIEVSVEAVTDLIEPESGSTEHNNANSSHDYQVVRPSDGAKQINQSVELWGSPASSQLKAQQIDSWDEPTRRVQNDRVSSANLGLSHDFGGQRNRNSSDDREDDDLQWSRQRVAGEQRHQEERPSNGSSANKWQEDRGHKRHGWKNVYHREELADRQRFHNMAHHKVPLVGHHDQWWPSAGHNHRANESTADKLERPRHGSEYDYVRGSSWRGQRLRLSDGTDRRASNHSHGDIHDEGLLDGAEQIKNKLDRLSAGSGAMDVTELRPIGPQAASEQSSMSTLPGESGELTGDYEEDLWGSGEGHQVMINGIPNPNANRANQHQSINDILKMAKSAKMRAQANTKTNQRQNISLPTRSESLQAGAEQDSPEIEAEVDSEEVNQNEAPAKKNEQIRLKLELDLGKSALATSQPKQMRPSSTSAIGTGSGTGISRNLSSMTNNQLSLKSDGFRLVKQANANLSMPNSGYRRPPGPLKQSTSIVSNPSVTFQHSSPALPNNQEHRVAAISNKYYSKPLLNQQQPKLHNNFSQSHRFPQSWTNNNRANQQPPLITEGKILSGAPMLVQAPRWTNPASMVDSQLLGSRDNVALTRSPILTNPNWRNPKPWMSAPVPVHNYSLDEYRTLSSGLNSLTQILPSRPIFVKHLQMNGGLVLGRLPQSHQNNNNHQPQHLQSYQSGHLSTGSNSYGHQSHFNGSLGGYSEAQFLPVGVQHAGSVSPQKPRPVFTLPLGLAEDLSVDTSQNQPFGGHPMSAPASAYMHHQSVPVNYGREHESSNLASPHYQPLASELLSLDSAQRDPAIGLQLTEAEPTSSSLLGFDASLLPELDESSVGSLRGSHGSGSLLAAEQVHELDSLMALDQAPQHHQVEPSLYLTAAASDPEDHFQLATQSMETTHSAPLRAHQYSPLPTLPPLTLHLDTATNQLDYPAGPLYHPEPSFGTLGGFLFPAVQHTLGRLWRRPRVFGALPGLSAAASKHSYILAAPPQHQSHLAHNVQTAAQSHQLIASADPRRPLAARPIGHIISGQHNLGLAAKLPSTGLLAGSLKPLHANYAINLHQQPGPASVPISVPYMELSDLVGSGSRLVTTRIQPLVVPVSPGPPINPPLGHSTSIEKATRRPAMPQIPSPSSPAPPVSQTKRLVRSTTISPPPDSFTLPSGTNPATPRQRKATIRPTDRAISVYKSKTTKIPRKEATVAPASNDNNNTSNQNKNLSVSQQIEFRSRTPYSGLKPVRLERQANSNFTRSDGHNPSGAITERKPLMSGQTTALVPEIRLHLMDKPVANTPAQRQTLAWIHLPPLTAGSFMPITISQAQSPRNYSVQPALLMPSNNNGSSPFLGQRILASLKSKLNYVGG